LLDQIEKRAAKRANDPAAAEKELSRASATQADRVAKLEDLRRKYSLRIQADLALVLAVRAPVRQMSIRLIRKREERLHILHWNSVLRTLESPLCEHCSARAHPLYLSRAAALSLQGLLGAVSVLLEVLLPHLPTAMQVRLIPNSGIPGTGYVTSELRRPTASKMPSIRASGRGGQPGM
jgi:hypothetical protein